MKLITLEMKLNYFVKAHRIENNKSHSKNLAKVENLFTKINLIFIEFLIFI